MYRELLADFVKRLPQGAISRVWGKLARVERPAVAVTALKYVFCKAVGIDLTEANGTLSDFATLEALFVRTLPPKARPIASSKDALASPVDARVGQLGTVERGTLYQIKGRAYRLAQLLGDVDGATRFEGGAYATLYLAPHNYHRIHAPLAGRVKRATVIPGGLLPVFPEALTQVDELFARNERVVTYLETPEAGLLVLVKVGATLVGRITTTYDASIATNQKRQKKRDLAYDPGVSFEKGAEIATFELGSTVLLIAERGRASFETLHTGDKVLMGQRIGTVAAWP